MDKKLYLVCTAALLIALATSCARDKSIDDIKPAFEQLGSISTQEVMPLNTSATLLPLNYVQYNNLPEPISDVAAQSKRRYSTGGSYRYPYAIGTSQVPGGHPYYEFRPGTSGSAPPSNGTWVRVTDGPFGAGGGILKLAFAEDGNGGYVRAIARDPATGKSEIWSTSFYSGWGNTHIGASDITYGYSPGGTAQLYFLGDENVQGGHRIYRDDNGSATEIISGSAAVSLAVDGLGRLWVVNSFDQIFVNASPQTGGSFVPVPGAGKRIASDGPTIGLLGNTFLNHGYEIYQRDATSPILQNTWELQGGDATQIASNAADDYFVVNDLGELFLATRQF